MRERKVSLGSCRRRCGANARLNIGVGCETNATGWGLGRMKYSRQQHYTEFSIQLWEFLAS
jgi:hypothetical protein